MLDPDPEPVAPPSWRQRLELLAGGDLPDPLRLAGYLLGFAALVTGGWLLLREPAAPVESTLPRAGATSTTATVPPEEVVVHASGAVASPGLYRLPTGARVADLLAAAGGRAEGADVDRLNLAAVLVDGGKVHVPRVGEPTVEEADTAPSGPLDLNTATAGQLEELPGIGPATAAAIVEARAERGRFRAVDDLLEVRGIGPAKLDALRGLVRV